MDRLIRFHCVSPPAASIVCRMDSAFRRIMHISFLDTAKKHDPASVCIRALCSEKSGPSLDVHQEPQRLTITQPDDWHLHLRDGEALTSVAPHSASVFRRAIIMPNLTPPVTSVAVALAYRERILKALKPNQDFLPLMTLYLTDNTSSSEVKIAKESGHVVAFKFYPAGATTNSQAGVTDLFRYCMPVLEEMVQQSMPLLIHGEVADSSIDIFDREHRFIDTVLTPLMAKFPLLKIVLEHITTQDAVEFVESCPPGSIAATVTPQHLLLNRNALFQRGIRPHHYCLPILKRETHRQALLKAISSGSKRYFIGTDSAPHERKTKEASCGCAGIYTAPIALPLYAQAFDKAGALDKLEAFTSFNGPDFYGLPRNTKTITLTKSSYRVPQQYGFGFGTVVPLFAGEILEWSIQEV
ncbi:hypothetical protein O6H91_10G009200 [Diphasiastrum complanatum]|uniref:Uncharacterized protein n=1 Tax=Diphasiastrum complanatum TaxID=34168 RepID=A0ACC2CEA2_DIPCM|nr:hypothetical protein O6H91_10G009200 [Diphasiastrum complanatum]